MLLCNKYILYTMPRNHQIFSYKVLTSITEMSRYYGALIFLSRFNSNNFDVFITFKINLFIKI